MSCLQLELYGGYFVPGLYLTLRVGDMSWEDYHVVSYLRDCVKKLEEGQPPPGVPGAVCGEVDAINRAVYGSNVCLSLEIQVLYTMNILVNDLLLARRQPTTAHIEALVGTIMSWGRIGGRRGNFKLAEQSREDPQRAVLSLARLLDADIGGRPLREYALLHDITSIVKSDLDKIVEKAVNALGGNYESTWKYKTLHIVVPSIFPAFDNNIARNVFNVNYREGSMSKKRYVLYSVCLGHLARYYVKSCSSEFERVEGFGYARKLHLQGDTTLYLPITRLLDYVVWSMSSSPDRSKIRRTIYDVIKGNCLQQQS